MKSRIIIAAVVAVLIVVAGGLIHHLVRQGAPLTVTFIGYTNMPGMGRGAVFGVTNTSSHQVRCLACEFYSVGGKMAVSEDAAAILSPGLGEHIQVPPFAFSPMRMAVLSTGTVKENWNRLLIGTSYVASNQWEMLQLDRSFSQWVQ